MAESNTIERFAQVHGVQLDNMPSSNSPISSANFDVQATAVAPPTKNASSAVSEKPDETQ